MSSSGRLPLLGDEQRDAGVDRDPLGVRAVADDDHVAGLEAERERLGGHREHPHAPADLRVPSPTSCSPSSTAAIAPIAVGASSRDASRDSRT